MNLRAFPIPLDRLAHLDPVHLNEFIGSWLTGKRPVKNAAAETPLPPAWAKIKDESLKLFAIHGFVPRNSLRKNIKGLTFTNNQLDHISRVLRRDGHLPKPRTQFRHVVAYHREADEHHPWIEQNRGILLDLVGAFVRAYGRRHAERFKEVALSSAIGAVRR